MATYRIGVYGEVLKKKTRRSAISFARQLRRELAKATPKDTGRAMSGWNATVGAPDYSEPGLLSETITRATALKNGREDLESFQLGEDFYIANGVPYIGRLNDGWSKQAPAGFIETTIDEFAAGHAGFEDVSSVDIEEVE